MHRSKKLFSALATATVMAGCGIVAVDPHINYITMINATGGDINATLFNGSYIIAADQSKDDSYAGTSGSLIVSYDDKGKYIISDTSLLSSYTAVTCNTEAYLVHHPSTGELHIVNTTTSAASVTVSTGGTDKIVNAPECAITSVNTTFSGADVNVTYGGSTKTISAPTSQQVYDTVIFDSTTFSNFEVNTG